MEVSVETNATPVSTTGRGNTCKDTSMFLVLYCRGGSRVWKRGCTLLKRLKTKKRRSRMSKGSSNINITMKLKYIIIIPFIVSLHCLNKHCDCFIRVTDWLDRLWPRMKGVRAPLDPPLYCIHNCRHWWMFTRNSRM